MDDDIPYADYADPNDIPNAVPLSHNEQFLVDGGVLAMASTNVEEMWFGCPHCANVEPQETLFVRFKSGGIYQYHCPLDVAIAFIETPSPGRYVWNELRDVYPYAKIGEAAKRPGANVVRKINT